MEGLAELGSYEGCKLQFPKLGDRQLGLEYNIIRNMVVVPLLHFGNSVISRGDGSVSEEGI